MHIQTSQRLINRKTYESFQENWNTNEDPVLDPNILDSGLSSPKKSFQVTLRLPVSLRGLNGFMLIKANILFLDNNNNAITLAIACSFTKPIIFSIFLGFVTSLIVVAPYCFFSRIHMIVPFLSGVIISAIYFARFYYRIKKISDPYLIELERKYKNRIITLEKN